MSALDEPIPGFADDNQLLHVLLGLAATAAALDECLDAALRAAPRADAPPPPADDPALFAVLGLVALQRRFRLALPPPCAAPDAPTRNGAPLPLDLQR